MPKRRNNFSPNFKKNVSKAGKGFKVLTDFTLLDEIDSGVMDYIKKNMDFLNQHGVREILRVIPTDEQDLGFNILSAFHYSKEVVFLTLPTREEAYEYLRDEQSRQGDEPVRS